MAPIDRFLELDRHIVGDIYTSREVMDNLIALCDDIGPRFAGTSEERKAAEFIAATLTRYGLKNAHLESYPIDGWVRGMATMDIVEPVARPVSCISLPYSPAREVVAELVDVRAGTPGEYEDKRESLRGNLALTSNRFHQKGPGRSIHRNEKYDRAVLAGACGFIWVNEQPARGPETGSLTSSPAPIPGVSISFEDGELLLRLLERHRRVRVRLRTTDRNEPRVSQNVVAELPGARQPDVLVVVGCHYDTHDIAPGAKDSTSGIVVVLEVARVLARYAAGELGCTIRFVGFGCEEIGMVGSQRYVEAHERELDQHRMVFNFDGAGAIEGRKAITLYGWPELEPFFDSIRQPLGVSVQQFLYAYADSFTFFNQGVPTASLRGSGEPVARGFGHTIYDTVDKIGIASLREVSAIAARMALRVATADEFPARRRSREWVEDVLKTDPSFEGYRFEQEVSKARST
ncbi:MAG: M28 family peptidase [Chloroflexi bacterium]|nr:M28 family peptidase [Chloroflexota bacterium]